MNSDGTDKRYTYSTEDDAVLLERARELAGGQEPRDEEMMDLLCFDLSGIRCAVEAGQVRHLLRGDACLSVPFSPPFLRGIAYYRGAFLAVVGAQELLDGPALRDARAAHLAIIGEEDDRICLALDSTPLPLAVPLENRQPLPEDTPAWLRGVSLCSMETGTGETGSGETGTGETGSGETGTGRILLLSVPELLTHPHLTSTSASAPERSPSC